MEPWRTPSKQFCKFCSFPTIYICCFLFLNIETNNTCFPIDLNMSCKFLACCCDIVSDFPTIEKHDQDRVLFSHQSMLM